jgi:hypothetical protein
VKTLLLAAIVALLPVAGIANDSFLAFDAGIAVDPVSGINATNGLPVSNTVRGVSPGGVPWRIRNLNASIDTSGRISVSGRGLLLAGGNTIGTNGGQSVHALLICGNGAAQTNHSTPAAGVALAANGDFRIDGTLSPAPPASCDSPVLLIVNTGGRWFAAGILANDGDDD